MTDCPVCGASGRLETITRERLPTMQNHRHTTRESALAAAYGELSILVCEKCGFAWNTTFEPALVRYDAEYENTVPSQIMAAHYEELVTGLTRRHDLSGGLVVDIGCGNASVLNMLMAAIPHSRGLGIDPALPRSAPEHDGRLRLVASPFAADLLEERPVLVLCRHVLEHIPDPISFLRTIVSATAELGPFPCYFEVPDLDWILRNEAFTDFCYEHCNYFTVGSLEQALLVAGFDPVSSGAGFGGQYLWVEAWAGTGAQRSTAAGGELAFRMREYGLDEHVRIEQQRRRLARWKADGATVALWGMATKGVIFALLVDPETRLVDVCVDVNPAKEGCFAPLTAHRIEPSNALRSIHEPLVVVVMNDNYRDEIAERCRELGLAATLVPGLSDAGPEGIEPWAA